MDFKPDYCPHCGGEGDCLCGESDWFDEEEGNFLSQDRAYYYVCPHCSCGFDECDCNDIDCDCGRVFCSHVF